MKELKLTVREDRVREVSSAISELGLDNLKRLEERDPQYEAIRFLVKRAENIVEVAVLVVANALISYRLTGPGESYWWEFAREAAMEAEQTGNLNVERFFRDFLARSRHNRLLVGQKISRIRRFGESRACQELIKGLLEGHSSSSNDVLRLWIELGRALGSKSQKTLSFAVKMLYYVARSASRNIELPSTIPIPVDLRVSMTTATSLLVSNGSWRRVWRELYGRGRGLAVEAWRRIGVLSRIPPLHIDALLWTSALEIKKQGFKCERAIKAVAESIYTKLDRGVTKDVCEKIAIELTRALCIP